MKVVKFSILFQTTALIFLYTRGIIDDKKEHLRQIGYYIGGAVLGLLTMAIYSQYLFK